MTEAEQEDVEGRLRRPAVAGPASLGLQDVVVEIGAKVGPRGIDIVERRFLQKTVI